MKIDRLIGILSILLQEEKTTAPEPAERFEVSRRTILTSKDMQMMLKNSKENGNEKQSIGCDRPSE